MGATAFFCMTISSVAPTACGGGSGGDEPVVEPQTSILGISASYTVSVPEQMSNLCDYTVTYYGSGNKLVTEPASWTTSNGTSTWKKTVNSIIFPTKFGLKLTAKLKDGADTVNVIIKNTYPTLATISLLGINQDATLAWSKPVDIINGFTHRALAGSKLAAWLETVNNRGGLVNSGYSFDKEGNITSLDKIE